ncbi:kinesin-like protein KIF20B isoform X2 [Hippoglossus stenolepis]|uniref:kinesin-like protein KIF20B isoform X2 n=1 Tax=Hippoglossus stenolepis TaxID=195615 RepID=UPI00159C933D|nr:kinesin-like protein KIF20B isoform X2 [Hippoglossus stenolepis]
MFNVIRSRDALWLTPPQTVASVTLTMPTYMMESCLAWKPERVGPVVVDDIRRDLLGEFAALPAKGVVQSQSENLQVYLRVRPFTANESGNGESQECVTIEGPDTVVLKAPRSCQSKSLPQTAQRFSFTQVFGAEASQRRVFECSVRGLVQGVLEGGNCLVFTYGVTNAGKTFTFLGPDHDSGLLPRSLSIIFNSIEGRLYARSDLKPQRCRDFSRLTPDQQVAESSSKRNLLRLLKESDKSLTSGRSTFLEGSSLSTDSMNSVSEADSFCLDVDSNIRFSVWVSFCEIYNDNIHDLLEQVPGGHHKRTVLRLSQDVKGNSFIKDLRWVQVNSSEEAYRVMKIGRKNQSFSSTKLNQASSRSHSIFSVRILKVDDVGVPRVLGISELALCDLAGSERCSRTHNTGERLKEAGNINISLLTLGKCINAMRLNQHAKFQHHIPFRESKLTHFLQFFFCGAGRVSMVVNINQNASCFDETLNVLKFSALAQKVVVLNSRPVVPDDAPHRSAMELSMIIDEADQRRNVSGRGRKSSLVAWETTLEDVLEDEDDVGESVMEGTVLEAGGEDDEGEEEDGTMEEEEKSDREAALRLVLEAQIREEVSSEFMELFNKMEKDYSDRLEKEREILEERAERRVEILKNLVSKTVDLSAVNAESNKEEQVAVLEGIISSMGEDLEKIKEDAQSVQHCLNRQTHTGELEALRLEKQQSHDQLQEALESLEQQRQKLSELMDMCGQKDNVINKVQAAMDKTVEDATRDRALVESIRSELLQLQETCRCRQRQEEDEEREKRMEEELNERWRRRREEEFVEWMREMVRRQRRERGEDDKEVGDVARKDLEDELLSRQKEVENLKQGQLTQMVDALKEVECVECLSLFSSLESQQKEASRLTKENKALVNGIFHLQTEMTSIQKQLQEKTDSSDSLSEQLNSTQTRLQDLQSQSEEKSRTINSLTDGMETLRHRVEEGEGQSVFHTAMDELKKESEAALERSADKSQQIQDLLREKSGLQEKLMHSENRCKELMEELANQRAEFSRLRAELDSEGGALRGRLEGRKREEREKPDLHQKVNVEAEERKGSVVEELKEEMHRLQEKKGRREGEEEEGGRSKKYEEVKREMERLQRLKEEREKHKQDVHVSPQRSNMADRKKIKTTGRKRKSCEVEELVTSENKRNKVRRNAQGPHQSAAVKRDGGALQKIGELIHSSPSILGSKGQRVQLPVTVKPQTSHQHKHSPLVDIHKTKTIIGLVSGHSVEREPVTTATRPRRGRRKLYKTDASSPLFVSPHMTSVGAEEEKESDHLIIRRQLRSKTCRK